MPTAVEEARRVIMFVEALDEADHGAARSDYSDRTRTQTSLQTRTQIRTRTQTGEQTKLQTESGLEGNFIPQRTKIALLVGNLRLKFGLGLRPGLGLRLGLRLRLRALFTFGVS